MQAWAIRRWIAGRVDIVTIARIESGLPRLLLVLLVALPLVAVVFAAALFGTRWLQAGGLGADDLSLAVAYLVIGVFALATLAQVVAVPWAIAMLIRNSAMRTARSIGAIAFGVAFAAMTVGVVVLTAAYAGAA